MLAPRRTTLEPALVSRISGTSITSVFSLRVHGDGRREAAHQHVLEQVRVAVLALRELQDHERAVAGGVEARIGEAEAHVRLREPAIPRLRRQLAGQRALRRHREHHAVGGERAVPARPRLAGGRVVAVVHQRRDELLVGAGDEVHAVTQFRDVAQHLDAAVRLGDHVHVRDARFSNARRQLVERYDEAAGVHELDLPPVRAAAAGAGRRGREGRRARPRPGPRPRLAPQGGAATTSPPPSHLTRTTMRAMPPGI